MADTLYETGRQTLFQSGWTTQINEVRLYTALDVLVDSQSATFTYSGSSIAPTADIVFSVAAGTNDVSYVIVLKNDTLDSEYYRKDLTQLYDFSTAGTLTVDTFTITATGTSLQADGREALFTTGWSSTITQARISNTGGVINTQTAGFTVNSANSYYLELDAQVIFQVPASTTGINNAQLLNASNLVYFSRTLPSPAPYSFTTQGELRINTWVIQI